MQPDELTESPTGSAVSMDDFLSRNHLYLRLGKHIPDLDSGIVEQDDSVAIVVASCQ